jgi:hypothetical protein
MKFPILKMPFFVFSFLLVKRFLAGGDSDVTTPARRSYPIEIRWEWVVGGVGGEVTIAQGKSGILPFRVQFCKISMRRRREALLQTVVCTVW